MTLGIVYAASRTIFKNESWQRTTYKSETQQSLYHFWEMVSYIANTLVFILSGVVIIENILQNQNDITDQAWGFLILLYVLVQVSRVIVVVVIYPGLRYFGYGLSWREVIILIWSGLRGVVALALSLILNRESETLGIPQLTQKTGALFVFFTGGVVFLTLIVNGSTAQFLLHSLGMDETSDSKMPIVRSKMYNKALEAFRDLRKHEEFRELREDEELGPNDWPSVEPYLTCLETQEEGDRTHRHCISVNENEQHRKDKQDIRLLLLNGVQAAYWRMIGKSKITQPAFFLLMRSIDEAIDMVDSDERLLDWQRLEVSTVHQFKCLEMRCLPQKLATLFTVAKLRLAYYICAAFLRAHTIARRKLRKFFGESTVVGDVIRESEAEGERAMQFLQELQELREVRTESVDCSQVFFEVRTESGAYSILLHISEYVKNLKKSGLLEAKEMDQLLEAVEMDLKKLLRKESIVEKFLAFFCILQLGVNYGRNEGSQLEEASRPLLVNLLA